MKIESIKRCPLFRGIEEANLEVLLGCLNASERSYPKNSFVFRAGEKPEYMGVVVSGCVHVIKEDYWGARTILTSVEEGEVFGESFSCAEAGALPVSAVTQRDAVVVLMDYKRIVTTCPSTCTFHERLIRNMLQILAGKNVMLTQKIEHITKKSTREKILSYLSEQAISAASDTFEIPFNRQELADYLAVERSALSNTLSKLRDEEILRFNKNRFTLLQ